MKKMNLMAIIAMVIGIILVHYGQNILSKNQPIDANILIIEGWLPNDALERVLKLDLRRYETIIVTGLITNKSANQYDLSHFEFPGKYEFANGGIYMNKEGLTKIHEMDTVRDIEVFSYGRKAFSRYPHYSVYINDSAIGGAFTTATCQALYIVHPKFPMSQLKRFSIYFDNHLRYNGEERILRIDSVKINNRGFAYDQYFGFFDEIYASNYLNIKSYSEKSAHLLKFNGFQKPLIVLDTLYLGRNKTRAFAVRCKKWIDQKYGSKPYAINIVSIDYHSRRTYQTFKSIEKGKEVGIISMPFYAKGVTAIDFPKILLIPMLVKEYGSFFLNLFY